MDECIHGSRVCQCGEPGTPKQYTSENCEPCGYFEEVREAVTSRGMDNAPVCTWHASRSWSSAARCDSPVTVWVAVKRLCSNKFPCIEHDNTEPEEWEEDWGNWEEGCICGEINFRNCPVHQYHSEEGPECDAGCDGEGHRGCNLS